MNVTSRVKGCSQRLYNNTRKETKCCKWKVILAVWKERAFPTADSHFACREMFFCGARNVITVPTSWSLNLVTSQFKPVKNSDSTSSRSYLMLTTYVLCVSWVVLSFLLCATLPTSLMLRDLTTLVLSGEQLKLWSFHYAEFSFFCFLPSLRDNSLRGIFFSNSFTLYSPVTTTIYKLQTS